MPVLDSGTARLVFLVAVGLCSALFFASSIGSSGLARRVVWGRSVEGRPLAAIELGDPASSRKVLVVGCIHGDECAGLAVVRALERGASGRSLDLWVVPNLNPDGRADQNRLNAHGVDLNRNFPWRWRPLEGSGDSGPGSLSEPESRFAFRLITALRPRISIWFHQHARLVDESGGSVRIERRYAALVGLPLRRLRRYPGSVVGWENHRFKGGTAFVVELPPGELTRAVASRYAQAVLEVGRM